MEERPHTGAMKRPITDRTRDDLMAFAAARVDARLSGCSWAGRTVSDTTNVVALCRFTQSPPSEKVVDVIDPTQLELWWILRQRWWEKIDYQ